MHRCMLIAYTYTYTHINIHIHVHTHVHTLFMNLIAFFELGKTSLKAPQCLSRGTIFASGQRCSCLGWKYGHTVAWLPCRLRKPPCLSFFSPLSFCVNLTASIHVCEFFVQPKLNVCLKSSPTKKTINKYTHMM